MGENIFWNLITFAGMGILVVWPGLMLSRALKLSPFEGMVIAALILIAGSIFKLSQAGKYSGE